MHSSRSDGRSAPPRLAPAAPDEDTATGDQRITYEDWLRLVARSPVAVGSRSAALAVRLSKGFFVVCCLSVAAACGWLLAILLQAA